MTRKEQLEEMLKDEPNDAFLHYGLAMEFVSDGNDLEAVKRFRQLIEVAPEYIPAYHQAGQALLRLQEIKQAHEILNRGVAVARQQGDMHAAEEMQALIS
jgi:tetratricopeptide (TPR) repeat protein